MGSDLFAGTWGSGVYQSVNGGSDWEKIDSGFSNPYITDLIGMNGEIFAGTNGGGVYYFEADGKIWKEINAGLTNKYVRTFTVAESHLFVGTYDGVSYSTGKDAAWTPINQGLHPSFCDVHSFAILDTELFIGTHGTGVWSRPLSEIFHDETVRGVDQASF